MCNHATRPGVQRSRASHHTMRPNHLCVSFAGLVTGNRHVAVLKHRFTYKTWGERGQVGMGS